MFTFHKYYAVRQPLSRKAKILRSLNLHWTLYDICMNYRLWVNLEYQFLTKYFDKVSNWNAAASQLKKTEADTSTFSLSNITRQWALTFLCRSVSEKPREWMKPFIINKIVILKLRHNQLFTKAQKMICYESFTKLAE